jgi:hypothetical protein
MFKGFQKEAVNSHKRRKATMEDKRQRILDGIDAWQASLAGMPCKGVERLSGVGGDHRLVWLRYAKQNVPLTAAGDLVGMIGLDQDEAVFWNWMREQVQSGAYDRGIEKVSAAIHRRLRAGRAKIEA